MPPTILQLKTKRPLTGLDAWSACVGNAADAQKAAARQSNELNIAGAVRQGAECPDLSSGRLICNQLVEEGSVGTPAARRIQDAINGSTCSISACCRWCARAKHGQVGKLTCCQR